MGEKSLNEVLKSKEFKESSHEERVKQISDTLRKELTEYRAWRETNGIFPVTKRERDEAWAEFEEEREYTKNMTIEEYGKYINSQREQRIKDYEQSLKIQKRRRIRNGVIVIFTIAAIAALTQGIILLKKHNDERMKKYFDDNGKAKRITWNVDESYLKGSIIYSIEDGKVIKRYRAQDIYFFINKETGEVIKHLYFTEDNFWLLFELDTEEMVSRQQVPDLGEPPYANKYYFERLKEEYDWLPLTSGYTYIENFKLKDAYTKEEIDAIEPIFVEGVKMIDEAAREFQSK
jgi:hypothetical protein